MATVTTRLAPNCAPVDGQSNNKTIQSPKGDLDCDHDHGDDHGAGHNGASHNERHRSELHRELLLAGAERRPAGNTQPESQVAISSSANDDDDDGGRPSVVAPDALRSVAPNSDTHTGAKQRALAASARDLDETGPGSANPGETCLSRVNVAACNRHQQRASADPLLQGGGDCSRCSHCHWTAQSTDQRPLNDEAMEALVSNAGYFSQERCKTSGASMSLSSSDIRSESMASCSPVSSIANCATQTTATGYSTATTTTTNTTNGKLLGSSSIMASTTILPAHREPNNCVDLLEDCCGCCCEQQSVQSASNSRQVGGRQRASVGEEEEEEEEEDDDDDDDRRARHEADEDGGVDVGPADGGDDERQTEGSEQNIGAEIPPGAKGQRSSGEASEMRLAEATSCDYLDKRSSRSSGKQRGQVRNLLALCWRRFKPLLGHKQAASCQLDEQRHPDVRLVQVVDQEGKSALIRVCSQCQCADDKMNTYLMDSEQQQLIDLVKVDEAAEHPSTGAGGMVIASSTANIAVQTTVRPAPMHHSTTTISQQQSISEGVESRRERKAAKTLAIITGVFVMCWLPFFIMAITMPLLNLKPHKYVFAVLLWLGYVNSMLNPIIYTIFSPDFRKAFKRLLCGSDEHYARRKRARQLQQKMVLDSTVELETGCMGQFQQQASTSMSVLSTCWIQCLACRWDLQELDEARKATRSQQQAHKTHVATSLNTGNNLAHKGGLLEASQRGAAGNSNNRGEFNSTSNEGSRYTVDSTTTSVSPKTIPSSLATFNLNSPGNKQLQVTCQASVTSGRQLIINDF